MTTMQKRVVNLTKAFTGDAAAQQLNDARGYSGGSGIDGGGRIDLGSATTLVLTVTDATGRVLVNGVTYTSDTDIAPTAAVLKAPLTATVASSNGTSTVSWGILK